MKAILKYSVISLLVGVAANCVSGQLQSTFLIGFLKGNLITILLALMAINGTTVGVVLTKMSDMANGDKTAFKLTRAAMHRSQIEQLFLIGIAVAALILLDSRLLETKYPLSIFWTQSIVIGVLFYGIVVLYDTTKSVFLLMEGEK